jgi:ribosome-associated toxin RatA of RatAB toxin-antitoxin module
MRTVEETTHVAATPDEVFAFVDHPPNQVAITPGLTAVTDVEPLPRDGKRLRYAFEMVGVRLTGALETTAREPGRRLAFETVEGPLSASLEWRFEPESDGARVAYAARYELPSRVLDAALEPVVVRYNARQLRTALSNVRDAFDPTVEGPPDVRLPVDGPLDPYASAPGDAEDGAG